MSVENKENQKDGIIIATGTQESFSNFDKNKEELSVLNKIKLELNKLKSELNPCNRGVEDYSDKGDFKSAYVSARKKGEKEFMYKDKRYSTRNTALEKQQIQMYGNTDKLINLPVSQNTKEEIKNEAIDMEKNKIDVEKLNRIIDINTLAGNPSYSQDRYKSPLQIAGEYAEEQSKIYNLKPLEIRNVRSEKLKEVISDKKYMKNWKRSQTQRDMYNPISNKIYGDNYLAEEAHGYRNNNESSELMAFVKDWIKFPFITEKGQGKGYSNPKHFEYDTHKNVEPILRAYKDGNIEYKDIPGLIDKIRKVPGGDKFMFAPNQKNVIRIQKRLLELGYNLKTSIKEDGSLDGEWNDETKEALLDWQNKNKSNF